MNLYLHTKYWTFFQNLNQSTTNCTRLCSYNRVTDNNNNLRHPALSKELSCIRFLSHSDEVTSDYICIKKGYNSSKMRNNYLIELLRR